MKDIRILLCEDDPSLGRLLSDYLKAKGAQVTWAQDGAEGLKAYHRDTYDFIVLDVMMPRKDGFQVAEEIRLDSRSIPILFLYGTFQQGRHPRGRSRWAETIT